MSNLFHFILIVRKSNPVIVTLSILAEISRLSDQKNTFPFNFNTTHQSHILILSLNINISRSHCLTLSQSITKLIQHSPHHYQTIITGDTFPRATAASPYLKRLINYPRNQKFAQRTSVHVYNIAESIEAALLANLARGKIN